MTIQTFETQYRLAPWARVEQRRLDRMRTVVLDNAFAWALDQVGMREEAELCIRKLFRARTLGSARQRRVDHSDLERGAGPGDCSRDRRRANSNVVVYHSRRQALMDLAVGVARGDLAPRLGVAANGIVARQ